MLVRKNILIVDDETEFAEMVQMRLEAQGYNVDTAVNGEEGLAKAQAAPPHVILLDVMMPGIDGFEVLRRLKRDPRTQRIAIIMLTAKGETASIFKAQDLGVVDYLIKPCDPQEMLSLIKRYT